MPRALLLPSPSPPFAAPPATTVPGRNPRLSLPRRRPIRCSAISVEEASPAPAVLSAAAPSPARPSPAEVSRTVVELSSTGTLSALTADGWPLGLGSRFVVGGDGSPALCLKDQGGRLSIGAKSSFHVQLEQSGSRIPQCTLLGSLARPEDRFLLKKLHTKWEKRFGEELDENLVYLFSVERLLCMEDIKEDGIWVTSLEYGNAEPDPLRNCAEKIVDEMNAKHSEDVQRLCNVHVDVEFQVCFLNFTFRDVFFPPTATQVELSLSLSLSLSLISLCTHRPSPRWCAGMGVVSWVLGGAFLALAVYCAVDPFRQGSMAKFPGFEAYPVEQPPWSELPTARDPENLLQRAELRFVGQVQGPESVTFDPAGRGPYTGVADGRVLFWDGASWKDFAYTSPNRSELCDPKPSPWSYLKNEHICGRPLGLRFDKKSGDLYIADAYFGLLKVGPEGGLATPLATEAEGVPFRFTNDLDIDSEGNVYFTDSSSNYQRRNFMQLIFTAEPSGRLLKYNPITKESSVLVQDLQFPNGVSISKDGTFLVFCEGSRGRLTRYWLKGERSGTWEPFAILPGFPDNVRTNEKGEFWVAIHCRRNLYSQLSSSYPLLRKFQLKLPISAKYQFLLHIGGKPHALIIKYGPNGELLKILEDRPGKVVSAPSEVEEWDGKLWIGSVVLPFIAVYDLA